MKVPFHRSLISRARGRQQCRLHIPYMQSVLYSDAAGVVSCCYLGLWSMILILETDLGRVIAQYIGESGRYVVDSTLPRRLASPDGVYTIAHGVQLCV